MVGARTVLALGLLFGICAAHAQTETPDSKKPRGYLPVEDVPKRQEPSMTLDERTKLVKELSAARDKQTSHTKGQESGKNGKTAKPK